MVLSWGVLLPLGILVARFLKITLKQDWPNELDNKFWWLWHLRLQISGSVMMLIGLLLILNKPDPSTDDFIHWYLGWAVSLMGVAQIISGWMRGTKGGPTDVAEDGSMHGDHYEMTTYRKVFEYYHKFVGYSVLLLSAAAILTGMWRSNAPVWMWIGLLGWWMMLIIVFAYCQSKQMAVDTYQAIWGSNKEHPGNAMKPIGFGIRRRPENHQKKI
ncbi:cytochrome B [Leucothrix arctica]|uniref:Cytochrome B n=2 Tax=Leucothrix arctica TaxID=1481894 RepID=A0A317CCI6_9GAMM|nr:cytochrome B [Leucothrix arctica]